MTKEPVAQFNGGIPLPVVATGGSPGTRMISVPINVDSGNCQLSLLNAHAAAIMYFKWVNTGSSTAFAIGDAGIVLAPGAGFVVNVVKPEMDLIGQSSVAGAICAVDFVAKLKG